MMLRPEQVQTQSCASTTVAAAWKEQHGILGHRDSSCHMATKTRARPKRNLAPIAHDLGIILGLFRV